MVAILEGSLLASCCCAAETLRASESTPSYSIAGSVWRSQGSLEFELGNDEFGTWSKVEWPLNGLLGGIEGDVVWPFDAGRALVVSIRYGHSFSMDGTSQDWDWRPWERPDVSDYSETDSSGDLQTIDVRVGFRFPIGRTVDLQLLTGYSRSSIDFEDQNLTGSYDYGQTPISYQGPVDTYSAAFSGLCLGGEVVARAGDKLTLSARVETILNLSVSADGDWIRRGNHFEQEANGTGLTVSGRMGYEIRPHVAVAAEAGWISQTARNGGQHGTQDGLSYDADIVREISLQYITAGIGVVVEF